MQQNKNLKTGDFALINQGVPGKEKTLIIVLENGNGQTLLGKTVYISKVQNPIKIDKEKAIKKIEGTITYFGKMIKEMENIEIELDTIMTQDIKNFNKILTKIKKIKKDWNLE